MTTTSIPPCILISNLFRLPVASVPLIIKLFPLPLIYKSVLAVRAPSYLKFDNPEIESASPVAVKIFPSVLLLIVKSVPPPDPLTGNCVTGPINLLSKIATILNRHTLDLDLMLRPGFFSLYIHEHLSCFAPTRLHKRQSGLFHSKK